jgi:hypothetical protein
MEPAPFSLSEHIGKVVELSGYLCRDLWEVQCGSIKVVKEDGYIKIEGTVVDSNVIKASNGAGTIYYCYRFGKTEGLHLDMWNYKEKNITVIGELIEDSLYWAQIVDVPLPGIDVRNQDNEAKSLEDLMHIRASKKNRKLIEKVSDNLGTALGFKWTNNQKNKHPCIIIFVPKKISSNLIDPKALAPEILVGDDGKWCYTDVVTGGVESNTQSELSNRNSIIAKELFSGKVGLIGGIRFAFEDNGEKKYGTGGIAALDESGKKGFLTNHHVAGNYEWKRPICHPLHETSKIGSTFYSQQYALFKEWYGIIEETDGVVQCDYAFVKVDESFQNEVRPGLHSFGKIGTLMRIHLDQMDIIGKKVISIGWKRGIQRGTVAGFSYEFRPDCRHLYTDLLIIGEDGPFSEEGCSGQIIVTDDQQHQPVALLWGGCWQESILSQTGQRAWSYATDLGKIQDRLKLKI